MRLGDFDELKEEINREVRENRVGVFVAKRIFDIIDNTPTVEAVPLEFHEKAMDVAVDDLFKVQEELNRVRNEKRQGEWIGNAFNEHHCNICGHPALWEEEPDDYYETQSRFCPNCGAEMKGGAE